MIGFFVLILLAFVISRVASQEGRTAELITRACGFGYAGTILTSLISAATFIFYTAIEGQNLADAAAELISLPSIVWYVIAGLVFIPLVWKGTSQLSWMMWITVPIYTIVTTVAILAALGLGVVIESILLFNPALGAVGSFAAYIGFAIAQGAQVVGAQITTGKFYTKE